MAGWHLLALINGVLDVSKIEGGHVAVEDRKVDVLASIEEAVRINQTDASKRTCETSPRIAMRRRPQPGQTQGDCARS